MLQDENHPVGAGLAVIRVDAKDDVEDADDIALIEAGLELLAARVRLDGVLDAGEVTFDFRIGVLFAAESTVSPAGVRLPFPLARDATVGVPLAFVVLRVGVRDRERGVLLLDDGVDLAGDLTVTFRAEDAGVLGVFPRGVLGAAFFADRAGVLAMIRSVLNDMKRYGHIG